MTDTTGAEVAVDASFVPVTKASVTSAELDGERVLYDVDSGRLQRLDPVGTIIWPFLDGSASIAELAADVAEAFAADVHEVRAGIVSLVTALLDEGLLVSPHDGGPAAQDAADATAPPREDPGAPTFLVDPPGG